jgi:HEAT repeat protein
MTSRWRWIGAVVLLPLGVLGVIAGTDGLFLRAVPLEQRLISHDEGLRKKAQQTLLGQSPDQKQLLVTHLIPTLSRPDPFARKWAAISFALIGPAAQPAIPALLQTVSDKETEVAQAARVALTEIGAPDASQVPLLVQSLGSASEEVRCEAAASIAKTGPAAEPAVPLLLAAVTRDMPLPECIPAALATLNDFIPRIETSLVQILHADNPHVRIHAADSLARLPGKNVATLQALLQSLGDESDAEVRDHLATALTLSEPPVKGYVPALIAGALNASDASVRSASLTLLKKNAPALSVVHAALAHALGDEDAEIRQMALYWVIEHPEWTRAFQDPLFGQLKDPVDAHRRLALEALYHVPWRGRDHVQDFALMQRDAESSVRCLAVRQLVEMGAADRVSIGRLTDDLRHDEDPPCAVEVLALTAYFNPEVIPAVGRLLDGKNDWRTRCRAVAVLVHTGGKAHTILPLLLRAQREAIPGADNAVTRLRQTLAREKRKRR